MDKEQLIKDIAELMKKYKKPPEGVSKEAEAYLNALFTDDKIDELAAGLVDIMEQHLNEAAD